MPEEEIVRASNPFSRRKKRNVQECVHLLNIYVNLVVRWEF